MTTMELKDSTFQFHDSGGHVVSCGTVNERVFLYIWSGIVIINSIYVLIRLYRAFNKALHGEKEAAAILVMPVYYQYLVLAFILFVLRALLLRFVPTDTLYFAIIYLGPVAALSAGIREGMFVFLIQDTAGLKAIRTSSRIAAVWGIIQAFIGIANYVNYNYVGLTGPYHYFGSSFGYYVTSHFSILIFYASALLYMFQFPKFKRRSPRISNLHVFYGVWQLVVYVCYFVGDLVEKYAHNTCTYLIVEMIYYSSWTFLTYYLLRQDSFYWRNMGGKQFVNPSRIVSARNSAVEIYYHDNEDEEDEPIGASRKALLEDYAKKRVEKLPGSSKLIDFSRLQIGTLIGKGGAGRVYKGKLDGKPVAVKRMLCQSLSKFEVEEYLEEVAIADQLKHPNVIELYGVSVMLPFIVLVMEYAHRGNLFKLLPKLVHLPFKKKLQMAVDFASALNHLHSQTPPVIHFDLKSLNLLVDKDWRVKLADFGEARKVHEGQHWQTSKNLKGTLHWLAPEAFKYHEYSIKTDIYAAGLVLYEIFTGISPWTGFNKREIPQMVMAGKRPTLPADLHPGVVRLIERCWNTEPDARPTALEVLQELQEVQSQMVDVTDQSEIEKSPQ